MKTRLAVERFIDLVQQGQADSYEAWAELYSVNVPQGEHDAAREAIGALAYEASPGFSLDPEWLPDRANPGRPLILQRLRAFIANPCGELQQIARRADVLEKQEPDELRQASRTRTAVDVRDALAGIGELPPAVCEKINREIAPVLAWLATAMAQVEPADWGLAQAAYYRIVQKLKSPNASKDDLIAQYLSRTALRFYDSDTSVQCGTYFGLRGTRVGRLRSRVRGPHLWSPRIRS